MSSLVYLRLLSYWFLSVSQHALNLYGLGLGTRLLDLGIWLCGTQVLDANSRTLLRKLEGHKTPVHVTKYSSDGLNILSGADDTTARWWDIASGKQVLRLDGNRDYVRAGAQSPSSESYWATGNTIMELCSGNC